MRAILAAFICLLVPGCVGFSFDRVSNTTRFRDIVAPADLCGIYIDRGNSPGGGWRHLSQAICEDISPSAKADSIRFRSVPPSTLVCEARSQGRIVASRQLVQDRDFRIAHGALQIVSDKAGTFLAEGMAGVEKHATALRLTDSGDLVMTQRTSEAGMALLVIPMARTDTMDTVFKRVRE